MKETISDFFMSLQNAVENNKCEKMTVDKEGFHAEYVTGENYVKLNVTCTQLEEGSEEKLSKKQKEEHNECLNIRNEFREYVQSLDNSIFNKTCKKFSRGKLHELHEDIMHGHLDASTLKERIKTFKDAVNQTIMEAVVHLKSQMS